MLLPQAFQFQTSKSMVISDIGCVSQIEIYVQTMGCERVMLISSQRASQGIAARKVIQTLDKKIACQYTQVTQHSGVDIIDEIVKLAQVHKVDGFIAVGGGSCSDSAKAAAILLAEGGKLKDHANVFYPPDRYVQQHLTQPKLPIIAIPLSLSAAEVTPGLGIRDPHGHKLVFWDPLIVPRFILLDGESSTDIPAVIFTTTGMNALAHCIEGMYSKVKNPISEALAVQGIAYLNEALPRIHNSPQDKDARALGLIGAYLSGMVISNARVGIHHGICHGLGALGGLSHGVANSIFLPHAMRFNLEVAPEYLAKVATAMGVNTHQLSTKEAALQAIVAIENLQSNLGIPKGLKDAGLDRSLLPQLAKNAMSDRGLYFNPRLANESEVMQLLEAAW
jgi:alcohol dehydrogenase